MSVYRAASKDVAAVAATAHTQLTWQPASLIVQERFNSVLGNARASPSESCVLTTPEARVPSSRPLDHRWDCARGLHSSTTRPRIQRGCTGRPSDPLVCRHGRGSRWIHRYPPSGQRGASIYATPPISKARQSNDDARSKESNDQVRKKKDDLEKEKLEWKRKEETLTQEIDGLQIANNVSKREIESVRRQTAALRETIQKLESDYKEKIQRLRAPLDQLDADNRKLAKEQDELAGAGRDFKKSKARFASEMELHVKRQAAADREAKEKAEAAVVAQEEEYRKRLELLESQALVKVQDEIILQASRKQENRSSYDEYAKLYRDLWADAPVVAGSVKDIKRLYKKAVEVIRQQHRHVEAIATAFPEKKHVRGFEHLLRRLDEHQQQYLARIETNIMELSDHVDDQDFTITELKTYTHNSRNFTRLFHFTTEGREAALAEISAWSAGYRSSGYRNFRLGQAIARLEEQKGSKDSIPPSESRAELAKKVAERRGWTHVLRYHVPVTQAAGEVDQLEAVCRQSFAERETYVTSRLKEEDLRRVQSDLREHSLSPPPDGGLSKEEWEDLRNRAFDQLRTLRTRWHQVKTAAWENAIQLEMFNEHKQRERERDETLQLWLREAQEILTSVVTAPKPVVPSFLRAQSPQTTRPSSLKQAEVKLVAANRRLILNRNDPKARMERRRSLQKLEVLRTKSTKRLNKSDQQITPPSTAETSETVDQGLGAFAQSVQIQEADQSALNSFASTLESMSDRQLKLVLAELQKKLAAVNRRLRSNHKEPQTVLEQLLLKARLARVRIAVRTRFENTLDQKSAASSQTERSLTTNQPSAGPDQSEPAHVANGDQSEPVAIASSSGTTSERPSLSQKELYKEITRLNQDLHRNPDDYKAQEERRALVKKQKLFEEAHLLRLQQTDFSALVWAASRINGLQELKERIAALNQRLRLDPNDSQAKDERHKLVKKQQVLEKEETLSRRGRVNVAAPISISSNRGDQVRKADEDSTIQGRSNGMRTTEQGSPAASPSEDAQRTKQQSQQSSRRSAVPTQPVQIAKSDQDGPAPIAIKTRPMTLERQGQLPADSRIKIAGSNQCLRINPNDSQAQEERIELATQQQLIQATIPRHRQAIVLDLGSVPSNLGEQAPRAGKDAITQNQSDGMTTTEQEPPAPNDAEQSPTSEQETPGLNPPEETQTTDWEIPTPNQSAQSFATDQESTSSKPTGHVTISRYLSTDAVSRFQPKRLSTVANLNTPLVTKANFNVEQTTLNAFQLRRSLSGSASAWTIAAASNFGTALYVGSWAEGMRFPRVDGGSQPAVRSQSLCSEESQAFISPERKRPQGGASNMKHEVSIVGAKVGQSSDPATPPCEQLEQQTLSKTSPTAELAMDCVAHQSISPPVESSIEAVSEPLSYQIPVQDRRNAALASRNNSACFWTYKFYRNDQGQPPSLHYCTTLEQAEQNARKFLDEPILGFDIEWEMGAMLGRASIKNTVSLIQLACEDKIALFQVALFKGETAEELMPPSLATILRSESVVKAGVNIQGDAKRIEACLGVQMRGLIELSHLYRVVNFSQTDLRKVNKTLVSLADQVQTTLLMPLRKDEVRVSAWSRKLNYQQTEYAGNDAYAGFQLYHALEAKRKLMSPMPPRPAFYELQQPLILGNGDVVVPGQRKTRPSPVTAAQFEAGSLEEEDEVFYDAVETQDDDILQLTEDLGALDLSYPSLPPPQESLPSSSSSSSSLELDGSEPELQAQTVGLEHNHHEPSTSRRSQPITSPALELANTWISTLTTTSKLPRSKLYAYHLWHHQMLSLQDVAAVGREQPLQISTVATYILDALRFGGEELPCEGGRLTEVLEAVPKSVRWRYAGWVERRIGGGERG